MTKKALREIIVARLKDKIENATILSEINLKKQLTPNAISVKIIGVEFDPDDFDEEGHPIGGEYTKTFKFRVSVSDKQLTDNDSEHSELEDDAHEALFAWKNESITHIVSVNIGETRVIQNSIQLSELIFKTTVYERVNSEI